MSRLKWPILIFLRYYRNLGLRVSLYALLSLAVALISPFMTHYLSDEITGLMDFGSVMPVLTILASSMLAVSTFSLNVMVSAHRNAAGTTTPRVHRLLLDDTTTQSVLATFIGAFVYSLSSIVLFQAGFYSSGTAVVVMAVTILVVVLVITSMLRWIQHLSELGSVDDSLRTATRRAREALLALARDPALSANPITDETILPDQTTPVVSRESGYLQLIDVSGLESCLPEGACIYIERGPGAHVLSGDVIAQVSGNVDAGTLEDLAESFLFGDQRSYEQDAAFGLMVLSEIAAKALSPGINDPGTAIEAVVRMKELLWEYARTEPDDHVSEAPHVFVQVPDHETLMSAAFSQVARDGAGTIEVAVHLRRAMQALSASGDAQMTDAACRMAEVSLDRSVQAGLLESELEILQRIKVGTSD